ncbi:hypothetical protein E4T56_gene4121, partial [Termitomyces sp. T112]
MFWSAVKSSSSIGGQFINQQHYDMSVFTGPSGDATIPRLTSQSRIRNSSPAEVTITSTGSVWALKSAGGYTNFPRSRSNDPYILESYPFVRCSGGQILISRMGMMTKESHSSYIKPQLRAVDSSSQSLSEDMNFDIDNEAISYSQPCDSFSSPTKPLLMDTVDWANSQPVALKSLLSEVKRIPEKRSINYEPTWSTFDSSFTQVPPTSRAPLEIRSRPLRRTNSSARARLGPEAASTSNPPPAPDGAFWCKDRSTILVACQNVSERMDENAFALAAQVRNTAPPHPSFKRKPRGLSYLPSTSNTKRASSTYPVIHDQESISRWKKGKQRASPLSEPIPVGATHQRLTSVPVVARPFQRVASSSTGPSTDFSSPESPDTSTMNIDIDADTQDETPPTSLSV